MCQENFEKFREIVLEDLSLQERLRAFTTRDEFIARTIEIGAENGFRFTAEDVGEAMRANRRAWTQKWI